MQKAGYTSLKRTRIAEIEARSKQTRKAADIITRLVEKYAYFDSEEDGNPLRLPEVYWNKDAPNDLVWMTLYDSEGRSVEAAEATRPVTKSDHLRTNRADFIFGPGETIFGTVFSVELDPPRVFGLEDEKLEAPEIARVIIDLISYENALNALSDPS